jgi:hypothetical protein
VRGEGEKREKKRGEGGEGKEKGKGREKRREGREEKLPCSLCSSPDPLKMHEWEV